MAIASMPAADVHDWSSLARLKPDENIQVVQANQISMEGGFTRYSQFEITLRTARGELSIPKDRVVRVSTKPRGRRQRNALIGAGIAGGGAGTAMALALAKEGHRDFGPGTAVVATAVWAAVGALVGAVIPPGATVYRVEQLPPGAAARSRRSVP